MELAVIRDRYLRDSFPKRLGALGANLARLSSVAKRVRDFEVIKSLLEESEYFIEWTIRETPSDFQENLVELQLRLALWLRWLEQDKLDLEKLSLESSAWSGKILERSGLMNA